MQRPRYYSLDRLLVFIPGANGVGCRQILADHRKLMQTVQGSTNNHQNWLGGYFDHVQDAGNAVVVLYRALSAARPLPFLLSDALQIVFLHDLEKPWKYELRSDGQLHHRPGIETKQQAHEFRMAKLAEYGITLTPMQLNALKYVEGELADYSPRHRVMNELAALCHMADVASARIWFDCPKESGDPWEGASRVRDC